MAGKNLVPHNLRIVEPVVDVANSRAEYRFQPDRCYLADARLINVGVNEAGGGTQYNSVLGAESVIKSMRLMDGATELDAINDFPQWRAVQKLGVSDDGAISVGRYLSQNGLGYIAAGDPDTIANTYGNGPDIQTAQPSAGAGTKAWVSLKSVFPFLRACTILPTSIFRQLRVEIEYHSSAEMANFVVDATQVALTTARALLLVDEVADPAFAAAALKSFAASPPAWRGVVNDSWLLDATTATADTAADRVQSQEQTQRLRAFDSQYLHNLVVKVTPLATPTSGANVNKPMGSLGSQAQYAPSWQLSVNGQNVLPREGIQGYNRALAATTDCLGTLNVAQIQTFSGFVFNQNGASAAVANTAGQAALWAQTIEQPIENLQMTIRRSGVFNNAQTYQQQRIQCFGEVAKQLALAPGAAAGAPSSYRILNVQ
jgi:hypothetical protein